MNQKSNVELKIESKIDFWFNFEIKNLKIKDNENNLISINKDFKDISESVNYIKIFKIYYI